MRRAPSSGLHQRIHAVVSRIPRGRVATYGQVARIAGLPGQARLVGYALHALPAGTSVPWQRVVNAQGALNGHVPITAILSVLAVLIAETAGYAVSVTFMLSYLVSEELADRVGRPVRDPGDWKCREREHLRHLVR